MSDKKALKKYKSFKEARQDQWVLDPGEEYYRQIQEFYRFAAMLSPPECKPGFVKFRNIEEAQQGEKLKN